MTKKKNEYVINISGNNIRSHMRDSALQLSYKILLHL